MCEQFQGKKKDVASLKGDIEITEHTLPLDDLCRQLRTCPLKGLSHAWAKVMSEKEGPNRLTPPKTTPQWVIFIRNVFSYFGILLWIGAILCFIAYAIQASSSETASKDNVINYTNSEIENSLQIEQMKSITFHFSIIHFCWIL